MERATMCKAHFLVIGIVLMLGTVHTTTPTAAAETNSWIARLEALHRTSDHDQLGGLASHLIDSLCTNKVLAHDFDNSKNVYTLVWLGKDYKGDPAVKRILAYEGLREENATTLPGVAKVFQVFISETGKETLHSQYVVTSVDDPLLAQIPLAVEKIFPVVQGLLSHPHGIWEGPPRPGLRATLDEVPLKHRRGTIKVSDVIVVPPDVKEKLEKLSVELENRYYFSPSAVDHARTIRKGITALEGKTDDRKKRIALLDATFPGARDSLVSRHEREAGTKAARGSSRLTLAQEYEHLVAVDKAYRETFEAAESKKVTGETSWSNTPRSRLRLGLGAAMLVHTRTNGDRVAVEDGKIVSKPLGSSSTALSVLFYPGGYDGESRLWDPARRIHFPISIMLTPDPGLGISIGYTLLEGLGVSAGVAGFLIDKPKENEAIGNEPKDKADPFQFATATAMIVGVTYALK